MLEQWINPNIIVRVNHFYQARIAQLVEHCTYEDNWPCKGLEFESRYGHFWTLTLQKVYRFFRTLIYIIYVTIPPKR